MRTLITLGLTTVFLCSIVGPAEAMKCKKDAAKVGHECLDKYESSVWTIDPPDAASLKKLRKLAESGNTTLAKVTAIAGAVQVGATSDDYDPGCPDDGAGCTDYFAFSLSGVTPSTWMTQIQAIALCRNSGKGLPDNATWTAGALGTPDPDPGTDNGTTDCNVDSSGVVDTGSRADCVSDAGGV